MNKFNGVTATVFNGIGLVSKPVIARLGRAGTQMVLGYRGSRYDEEKMRVCGGLGQIYFAHYHLKDEQSLYDAMQHSDVVINCIGKENETRNFSFDEVHVEGPRRMARIAREVGVKRFIHLSALNCSPNPTPVVLKNGSQFLKSKYYGELAVREEFPDATIFRPADILGEHDRFLNHFTSLLRCRFTYKLAIWDYYDGVEKQPVLVNDLAKAIEIAALTDRAKGKTYQAVGPYRYNFYELIEYMRACGGQGQKYDDCRITNLRWDIPMRLYLAIVPHLQKYPWLTWERCERDSISDYVDPKMPTLLDLGVEPTPLEIHIQTLAHWRPRDQRVEIPYESAIKIDLPKKLNVAV